jgi:signal transduction histidine kinase
MKDQLKKLSNALSHLNSNTREISSLPTLSDSDPFSEIFNLVNQLSLKLEYSKSLIDTFHRVIHSDRIKNDSDQINHRFEKHQIEHIANLAQLGLLTTEISHEMTQPLTYLMNFLHSYPKTSQIGKQNESLDFAIKEVYRLINLVNQIQEFGQNKNEINPVSVNSKDVLDQALNLLNENIKSLQIKLKIDIKDDLPLIKINPNELEQVFINLIQNSIDSLKQINRIPKLELKLYVDSDHNNLIIEINDNGSGMDENMRINLFVPFFTTKSSEKGTGLGLTISRRIIQKYKGTIQCNSELNHGTSFILTFPIYKDR